MFNETVGADEVTSTKQAVQFGIMKKMKFVIPLVSPFIYKSMGPEVLGGMVRHHAVVLGHAGQIPAGQVFRRGFP